MGFLLDSLKCLDEDLREKGSCLVVAEGKPLEVMESFIKEFRVKKLTFERDTEPYNKAMDNEITKKAQSLKVNVESFWGHTLFDPDYLLSLNDGKAPLTMGGFLKVASLAGAPSKPLDAPMKIPAPPSSDVKCRDVKVFSKIPTLSDLKEYGYNPKEKTTWFIAGEKEAIKRMEEFLAQKKDYIMIPV